MGSVSKEIANIKVDHKYFILSRIYLKIFPLLLSTFCPSSTRVARQAVKALGGGGVAMSASDTFWHISFLVGWK